MRALLNRLPARPPAHLQFVEQAAAAAGLQLPNLNSQGLANTAWGISYLPSSHPALQRLARELHAAAVPRLASFSPQELGMNALACERTPHCSPDLLAALGQQLQQRAAQLADRDISTLLAGALPAAACLVASWLVLVVVAVVVVSRSHP